MPPTPNDIDKVLIPVWTQIAQRYKDRSEYVLYEILNEPHTISPQRWAKIQDDVIKAIRKIDKKHTIIVTCTSFSHIDDLDKLPKYADKNLIYTFHFYDPGLLTHSHQFSLDGIVPWPYEKSRMPSMGPYNSGVLSRDMVSYLYNNYEREASHEFLINRIDKAVSFSKQRNVPVFCGEWGTNNFPSRSEDAIRWHQFISNVLNERNIPWVTGNYYGFFGMFNPQSREKDINSNLDTKVLNAMGFTPPPQRPQTPVVLKSGFTIFDGSLSNGFFDGESYNYAERPPLIENFRGASAMHYGNVPQHYKATIIFKQLTDLSSLVSAGYLLEFKACADKPVSFDIRFVNPENANSIPWRMRCVIDEKSLPPDGNWHTIRIPLKNMQEHGAYVEGSQQWTNARNAFSWKQIRTFEISPEYSDLKGINIWFDSIRIVAP